MTHVAAYSILALTVGLSLARPRVGRLRFRPASAAILGASLTMAVGLLTWTRLGEILVFLSLPVLTIASLMVITLIAEKAGIFRYLAWRVALAAEGDGRKLFAYLFFLGTLTGAIFTNDAAVLIFTPMVFRLVEQVQEDSWQQRHKVVYYFAVLYVANLVAPLVISNPINIIVANWYSIGFAQYAFWMVFPALVSIFTTYFGLRFFFRRSIPNTYRIPGPFTDRMASRRFLIACAVIYSLTLIGFFTEQLTGLLTAYVAGIGAVILMALYRFLEGGRTTTILRGVGWGVLIFVMGIFVVANGLRAAGLTERLGQMIMAAVEVGEHVAMYATSFLAAGCSAVMNNHPVADTMALSIRDLPLEEGTRQTLALAALIGGDLGPKMLPIGSLAALLWFRILRGYGVDIPYRQYIKLGVPVTLAAILLACLALSFEVYLFRWFG